MSVFDGVSPKVGIPRSHNSGKISVDTVSEASEPGGQDVVNVLPPTSLPPLASGGSNRLQTEPPEIGESGSEELGGAMGDNSLQVPRNTPAPHDGLLTIN